MVGENRVCQIEALFRFSKFLLFDLVTSIINELPVDTG